MPQFGLAARKELPSQGQAFAQLGQNEKQLAAFGCDELF